MTEIFRQGLVEGDKQVDEDDDADDEEDDDDADDDLSQQAQLFSYFKLAGCLPSDGMVATAAGAVNKESLSCKIPGQAWCAPWDQVHWQKFDWNLTWICVEISADADVADIYEQYEQQIEKFKEVKIYQINLSN